MGAFGFGGPNGTNYQAQMPSLQKAATTEQATHLYDQSEQGLAQQQEFLKALAAQNGVQNQSAVYNQLAGVANGTGYNPAQALLAQQTGQNVANQASLAAGQRGASSNVGLLARQAANTGANLQQQAVGQGASLQAQQSMGALNQMGNLATQQVGQQSGTLQAYNQNVQGEQSNILNAIGQYNNASVGAQASANTANASNANTRLQGQQQLLGGGAGAAGVALAALAKGGVIKKYADGTPNAPIQINQTAPMPQSGAPQAPTVSVTSQSDGPRSAQAKYLKGMQDTLGNIGGGADGSAAQQNQQNFKKLGDSIVNAGYKLFSSTPAYGGSTENSQDDAINKALNSSSLGTQTPAAAEAAPTAAAAGSSVADLMPAAAASSAALPSAALPMAAALAYKGGKMSKKVPAMVSPGEVYLPPSKVKEVKEQPEKALKKGIKVPGKAAVSGDSPKNDTVRADLDEGGIVIPRSVVNSKDAPKKAAEFVAKVLAGKHRKR